MSIEQVGNKKPQYTINNNGAIEIKSIKNEAVFNFADKYDNAGLDDDLLQGNELKSFLQAVDQDEKMKQILSIYHDQDKYVYYEQKDKNGNLLKRSVCTKKDGDMMTFMYKNGKPAFCTSVANDGEKDIINLTTGKSKNYLPGSNEARPFTLNQKNCEMLKRVALNKPAKFNNGLTEFFYRVVKWDWDMSWSQYF